MAEITSAQNSRKRGGIRAKKLSTRVDLTPMVDLGFLLITFFVFTTSISEANAMRVILPSDEPVKDSTLAPASKTISLILEENNAIFYYHGMDIRNLQQTNYAASGIGDVIQKKINVVTALIGKPGETIVLIKPTRNASYRNLVDILDEMLVNGVTKYVLMEASEEEEAMVLKKEKNARM